jgi:hypothetical protein
VAARPLGVRSVGHEQVAYVTRSSTHTVVETWALRLTGVRNNEAPWPVNCMRRSGPVRVRTAAARVDRCVVVHDEWKPERDRVISKKDDAAIAAAPNFCFVACPCVRCLESGPFGEGVLMRSRASRCSETAGGAGRQCEGRRRGNLIIVRGSTSALLSVLCSR